MTLSELERRLTEEENGVNLREGRLKLTSARPCHLAHRRQRNLTSDRRRSLDEQLWQRQSPTMSSVSEKKYEKVGVGKTGIWDDLREQSETEGRGPLSVKVE